MRSPLIGLFLMAIAVQNDLNGVLSWFEVGEVIPVAIQPCYFFPIDIDMGMYGHDLLWSGWWYSPVMGQIESWSPVLPNITTPIDYDA